MAQLLIALGANVGDREHTLREALSLLPRYGIDIHVCSSFIETEALTLPGCVTPQPKYLNGVCIAETKLLPEDTLIALREVERILGRTRSTLRWESRTIDLDLIAYDSIIHESPTLTLPHPEMHKRLFVLDPLCEIAPEWVHPVVHKTARVLREELMLG